MYKGQIICPVTGTPQGGVISPILANIYLHYVLDVWFYETVQRNCRRQVYLCRYADDFVCAFEYEEDAQRFYKALKLRLNKFSLEVSEDKPISWFSVATRYERKRILTFWVLNFAGA